MDVGNMSVSPPSSSVHGRLLDLIAKNQTNSTLAINQSKDLIRKVVDSNDLPGIQEAVEFALAGEGGALVCRSVLSEVVSQLAARGPKEGEKEGGRELDDVGGVSGRELHDLWIYILDRLKGRYDEEEWLIRQSLSSYLSSQGSFGPAADCLSAVKMALGGKEREDAEKLKHYTRVAELYLKAIDIPSADIYINKANAVLFGVPQEEFPRLHTDFITVQASLMDWRRMYIDAAQKFFFLSKSSEIRPSDQLLYLNRAAICCILSDAGSRRSRLLASLIKDDRMSSTPSHPLLLKVFMKRILRKEDMETFQDVFEDRHRSPLPDGPPPLERAAIQHNLEAASEVYSTLRLPTLGDLLVTTSQKAEHMTSLMISEGRLPNAVIDHEAGVLRFNKCGLENIRLFNSRIAKGLHQVDVVLEEVEREGGGPSG